MRTPKPFGTVAIPPSSSLHGEGGSRDMLQRGKLTSVTSSQLCSVTIQRGVTGREEMQKQERLL